MKFFLIKSRCYSLKLFMNIYSALILTTVTASRADSHTLYLRCTVYLQHALLLLLPPFLTLSLLIRVPRPAVTLPGLGQHREWHLPDPSTHPHTHKYWCTQSQSNKTTTIYRQPQSHQWSGKAHIIHMGPDTHMQRHQHPHSPQEKRKRREKQK